MYRFKGMIHRVVDGDTYDVILDLGFSIAYKIRVRLRGVDTAEIFGNKASEEGKVASEYVKGVLEGKKVTVVTYKNAPSTFNRWEADVFLDQKIEETENLAEHLVKKGYAKKVDIAPK